MPNGIKKFFSLFVLIVFMLTILFPNMNTVKGFNYSDDLEFVESLSWMYNNGFTKYDKISDFMPNYIINREQSAKFMGKFMEMIEGEFTNKGNCDFLDLSDADETLQEWIIKTCEYDVIKGFENKFFPKGELTKAQAITILVRAIDGLQNENSNPWWSNYYNKAYNYNLTKETDVWNLDKGITRYEFTLLLKRAYDLYKGNEKLSNINVQNLYNIPEQNTVKLFEQEEFLLANNNIYIKFDSSMDKQSVENNLKIYPNFETKLTWSGDQNLNIEILDEIEKELEIILNIGTDAKDLEGNNLSEPILKQFKTSGIPAIDFYSPDGDIKDLEKNITVRFSKPMVSLTALDNQEACPIEISPSLTGKCVWITTTTFQFRPEGNFPIGGKYKIKIPSGLSAIDGTKTLEGKEFEIKTSELEVTSLPNKIDKDKEVYFRFNAPINLEKFKSLFSLSDYDNSELEIKYMSNTNNDIYDNIISVYPKSGDWGYSQSYNYTLEGGMTSKRGNVGLNKITGTIRTNDLLIGYNPFINKNDENPLHKNNMILSENENIIRHNNPQILLSFFQEIPLDKNLFSLFSTEEYDFDLNYAKKNDCTSGICEVVDDKKSIVITVKGEDISTLNLTLKLSQIEKVDDETLIFGTKNYNKINNFNGLDYRSLCFEFKYDIDVYDNLDKYFEFSEYSKVYSLYKLNKWSNEEGCYYEEGKNKYILNVLLNPDTDYSLKVSKDLIDEDNYPFSQDYNFSFKTNEVMNQDKHLGYIDYSNEVLIPEDVDPISVGISSTNIDKVNVKVCEGNFDINYSNFVNDENCKTKTININNLGFQTNFSVINLTDIYGQAFTKNLIRYKVYKLDEDKAEWETSRENIYKSFYRTNYNLVVKQSIDNDFLRITDFDTGIPLEDGIEKISLYNLERSYDFFGNYKGEKGKYIKDIIFEYDKNGIYKLKDSIGSNFMIIKLKNGKEVFLRTNSNYYSDNKLLYLHTDRPLYKAGNTVHIKGIGRISEYDNWSHIEDNFTLTIRDPQYKQIFKKDIKLDSNGTFELNFELEEDAFLGDYHISALNNTIYFSVEEYEKPDFEVNSSVDKEWYIYGDNAQINVEADYFMGTPLSNGEGNYRITASDFFFDGGKTKGYMWGTNNRFWRDTRTPYSSQDFINQGEFKLDEYGRSVINFKLDNNQDQEVENKIYNVSLDIKDPNTKKTVSDSTTFKVLKTNNFVGMKMDKYYYALGDDMSLGFVSVDLNGDIKPNQSIDLKIKKLENIQDPNTYIWENEEKLLLEKTFITNDKGVYDYSYNIEDTGSLIFEISNGKYTTTKILYISGKSLVTPVEQEHALNIIPINENVAVGENMNIIIQSPVKNTKGLITIEKSDGIFEYEVIDINSHNQEYSFSIKESYIPNINIKAFIVKNINNSSQESFDKLSEVRTQMNNIEQQLYSGNNDTFIVCPIHYDLIGYGDCSINDSDDYDMSLLSELSKGRKQEFSILQDILPNYYMGSLDLPIDLDYVKLDTTISTNKETYLPGDTSVLTLKVSDNDTLINGEATVWIIDKALLSLKADNSQSLLDYFYSNRYNNVSTRYNLNNLIKRLQFNPEENFGVDGMNAERGGVMTAKSMSNMAYDDELAIDFAGEYQESEAVGGGAESNATKIRNDFKDLAFYRGTVNVVNGVATINVPKLPDDLTTWVAKGFVFTNDMKVSNFDTEFKTQKMLSLIPSVPRFFTFGDDAVITSVIVNNSTQDLNVNGSLTMTNASVDDSSKDILVPANSKRKLEWKVKINDIKNELNGNNYSTQIDLKITAGELSDHVQLEKIIIPYSTPEYTFTNGSTNDLSYEEKIFLPEWVDQTRGQLEISLGSNILTDLGGNLEDMQGENYVSWRNLSSILNNLYYISILTSFYDSISESDKLDNIYIIDSDDVKWSVAEFLDKSIDVFEKFQKSDGGMAYTLNCYPNYYKKTCSNFFLTSKFLLSVDKLEKIGYFVDDHVVENALEYYKSEILDRIKKEIIHNDIYPFYILSIHDQKDFVKNNIDYNYETLPMIDKLYLALIYQNLNYNTDEVEKILKDINNSTIIEARGILLPANYDNYTDNVVSTSLGLKVLLNHVNNNEMDKYKFLIENISRWLAYQKEYSWENTSVLESLTKYVFHTGEFDNIDFIAKTFLNNNEVMNNNFSMQNKFDVISDDFDFGTEVKIGEENSLGFEKIGTGKLYYDIGLRYYLPIDQIEPRDEGIIIDRNYYNYDEYLDSSKQICSYPYFDYGYGVHRNNHCYTTRSNNLESVKGGKQGNYLVGEIEIIVPHERKNVIINNYIPAGAELVNDNLDTSSSESKKITGQTSDNWWGGFDYKQIKNDRLLLYSDYLPKGTYKYTYVLKLNHKGTYHHRPATVEEMEKPEIWGRTQGGYFLVY